MCSSDLALSVNGLRVSNNNFLLNGVDNNEFGLGGVVVLPPPDAIQEFRTEENSMSAEFGRGGAAEIGRSRWDIQEDRHSAVEALMMTGQPHMCIPDTRNVPRLNARGFMMKKITGVMIST